MAITENIKNGYVRFLKHLPREVFWTGGSQVIARGASFVSTLLLLRSLSISDNGWIAVIQGVSQFLVYLMGVSLPNVITREVSGSVSDEQSRRLGEVATFLPLFMGIACFSILGLIPLSWLVKLFPNQSDMWPVAAALAFCMLYQQCIAAFHTGSGRNLLVCKLSIASSLVGVTLAFGLTHIHAGRWSITCFFIQPILQSLLLITALRRTNHAIGIPRNATVFIKDTRLLLGASAKIFISNLVVAPVNFFIYSWLGRSDTSGLAVVQFNFLQQIKNLVLFISQSLSSYYYPRFAGLGDKGKAPNAIGIRAAYKSYHLLTGLGTGGVGIFLVLFSDIAFRYAKVHFQNGTVIMVLLVGGVLFTALSNINSRFLEARRLVGLSTILNVIWCSIVIAFLVFGIGEVMTLLLAGLFVAAFVQFSIGTVFTRKALAAL